jgi:hypothetical protein
MTADSAAAFDLRDVWKDMEMARGVKRPADAMAVSGLAASSTAAFNRSNDGEDPTMQPDGKPSRSKLTSSASIAMEEETKTKKAPKKAVSMTYKTANVHMDTLLMMYYLQLQLYHAKRLFDDRQSSLLSIYETMEKISVRQYIPQDLCEMTCRTESFPIILYVVTFESDEMYARAQLAPHMFMKPEASQVAMRFGHVLMSDVDRVLVHVCSNYCPYQIRLRNPELFGNGTTGQSNLDNDDDDAAERRQQQEEDQDAVWASDQWHLRKVSFAELPTPVYFCRNHYRFHVCNQLCDSTVRIGHANMCAISRREVSNIALHQFGDGVGTAEQMEKTDANKGISGGDGDGTNNKRRRRSASVRAAVFNAATHVVNGVRQRRGVGTRANSKRRLAGKARRTTQSSKQTPITLWLTAEQLESNGCHVPPDRAEKNVTDIARPPFSERVPGTRDAEFLLDGLRNVELRSVRRTRFTLPAHLHAEAYYSDPQLFALTCEEVASVFFRLIAGAQRRAINEARMAKVEAMADKAVEQYITQCRKARKPEIITQCELIRETTRKNAIRIFPVIQLASGLYEALETHYTLQVIVFYFTYLAAPVRGFGVLASEVEDTVGTGFALGHFAVVILDLMRNGLVVDGITILERDTFLLTYFPDSGTIKALGMLEKTCTYIKGLVMTYIRAMRTHGIPLLFLRRTALSMEEIATAAYTRAPGAEVVRIFTQRRIEELRSISVVTPPSPLREVE